MKPYISALLLYACIQLSSCQAMELTTPQTYFTPTIIAEIPIFYAFFAEFINNEEIIINGRIIFDNPLHMPISTIKNWKTDTTITITTDDYGDGGLSPNKTMIALTNNFNKITLYDTCGKQKISIAIPGNRELQCAFTACNDITFTHYKSDTICLLDTEKNSTESYSLPIKIRTYTCHPKEPKKICVPFITNCCNQLVLNLYTCDLTTQPVHGETKKFQTQHKPIFHPQLVTCTYNHNGSLFACTDTSGNVYIADLNSNSCILLPKNTKEEFDKIFFYNKSPILAILSTKNNIIRFWNSQTIEQITEALPLSSTAKTLAFSPNGDLLLLALWDNTIITYLPIDVRYDLKSCIVKYLLFDEYNKNTQLFPSDIMRVLMKTMLNAHKRC